jgi:two-component system NtrC family sensor kinase
LKVTTTREDGVDGAYLVIAVSDTGPGMTDQPLGTFERSARAGGKGFGLFISYEVLKFYNGQLKIESRRNEGTTVRLALPLHQEQGDRHE